MVTWLRHRTRLVIRIRKCSISIKYILVPDWVISRTDGDKHFISSDKLARLYGVPLRECMIATDFERQKNILSKSHPDAEWLFPDFYGKYKRRTG